LFFFSRKINPVFRQLEALGMRDPSDPEVAFRLGFDEAGYEEETSERLEETAEATDKFHAELSGRQKFVNLMFLFFLFSRSKKAGANFSYIFFHGK
jgi:hypothetical protein